MKKHKQRFEHEYWETRLENLQKHLELNQKEGWELVTAMPYWELKNWYILFFKRPYEEKE